ncbi:hypothetical protein [Kribbella sp. CA-293567]|uniref:hypothetical protein n=1 Tax=Kribbella sp. CA-293567 TaxID=3002436 RepID=UPI0022DE31D2|nr:hypothetical protein [Kribbella sp. CA-293567]WBQ02977.1 hypothetical protein OX958_23705 [Kribbella sp. CA-293567]
MTRHDAGESRSLMLRFMIDTAGRKRIADLVRAQMGWLGLSGPKIEAGGRVSRATVDRVKRADEKISDNTLRGLGDALSLPRDFLLYVGAGDIERVEAASGDPDLIRWTVERIRADEQQPAPKRTRKAAGS